MRAFTRGELDVLVATTVIEVGVDVPNSSVMIIMDADRFGVSQLHQLRGRVGRGGLPGLCLLVSDFPAGTPARARLDAVAATLDGFELSRVDLEQRREGDVLGAAQSGKRSSLKMLQLLRDEDVIATARDEAAALLAEDPALSLARGAPRGDRPAAGGRASGIPRERPDSGRAGMSVRSPAAGTASPRMPSPAGPTLGSGAEGTGVRKGSRSRRSAFIWVTSKAADLILLTHRAM